MRLKVVQQQAFMLAQIHRINIKCVLRFCKLTFKIFSRQHVVAYLPIHASKQGNVIGLGVDVYIVYI